MIPVSGTHRFLKINPSFIYVAKVDVIYVTEKESSHEKWSLMN